MPRTETERRVRIGGPRLERRQAEGDLPEHSELVGHAAVFDEEAVLVDSPTFRWVETIRRGAFTATLAEQRDVVALFNHDNNFILGRTASDTLRLSEDDRGLLAEIEILDTQVVRDLVVRPIERGDLRGMSFAFVPRNGPEETITHNEDGSITIEREGERITVREEGRQLIEAREILSVDLFDVSVVTQPAYQATDVGLRSIDPAGARERAARQMLEDRAKHQQRVAYLDARLKLAERS